MVTGIILIRAEAWKEALGDDVQVVRLQGRYEFDPKDYGLHGIWVILLHGICVILKPPYLLPSPSE